MLASPPVLLLKRNEFRSLSGYAVTAVLTYSEQPLAQRRPALALREAGCVESFQSCSAELVARVADGEELLGGQVLQHRAQLVGCEHGEGHDTTLNDANAVYCSTPSKNGARTWRTGEGNEWTKNR